MNHDNFKTWLVSLGNAWINLDSKAAANICSEDVVYFENIFLDPLTSRTDVEKQWYKDLEFQKDVKFDFEIISVNQNVGVARWWATLMIVDPKSVHDETYIYDGIFVVRLDDQGLCKEFRQWFMCKK
jgi:hypothetical protein